MVRHLLPKSKHGREGTMKSLHFIVISCIVWGLACESKSKQQAELGATSEFEVAEVATARDNIETVCNMCHSPTAAPDNRLAPPLEIAKRNYLAATQTKEEFVDKVVQFILYPTAEQAMLHSDVEEFGVMDPVGFSEEDVRAIAVYMYENDLEKPSWLKDQ